eukprot:1144663-Pelagomonas_calceolata.AAC.1
MLTRMLLAVCVGSNARITALCENVPHAPHAVHAKPQCSPACCWLCVQSDARIAALYEDVLVEDADERKLGAELRKRLGDTIRVRHAHSNTCFQAWSTE